MSSQIKQLHTCFFLKATNHHTSVHSRSAFCEFPISSHWILKRCVLRGQDLIKLITFTVSSRISLSKGGNFLLCVHCRGIQCHWCHCPDSCKTGGNLLLLHHQCKCHQCERQSASWYYVLTSQTHWMGLGVPRGLQTIPWKCCSIQSVFSLRVIFNYFHFSNLI